MSGLKGFLKAVFVGSGGTELYGDKEAKRNMEYFTTYVNNPCFSDDERRHKLTMYFKSKGFTDKEIEDRIDTKYGGE